MPDPKDTLIKCWRFGHLVKPHLQLLAQQELLGVRGGAGLDAAAAAAAAGRRGQVVGQLGARRVRDCLVLGRQRLGVALGDGQPLHLHAQHAHLRAADQSLLVLGRAKLSADVDRADAPHHDCKCVSGLRHCRGPARRVHGYMHPGRRPDVNKAAPKQQQGHAEPGRLARGAQPPCEEREVSKARPFSPGPLIEGGALQGGRARTMRGTVTCERAARRSLASSQVCCPSTCPCTCTAAQPCARSAQG